MSRIAIVDSYYPQAIASMPINPAGTYESELQAILSQQFGTADFVSRNLRALGWEAIDIIANHFALQALWVAEHGGALRDVLSNQLASFKPDVVLLQDLNIELPWKSFLVAGFHSCPWAGDEKVKRCSVIATSFPHYVKRIEALGVRAVYSPLAFEQSIELESHRFGWAGGNEIERLTQEAFKHARVYSPERIHDCVFIGGVGNPSHWSSGMKTLETVAREMPIGQFKWWGYGLNTLRENSPLRGTYQGEAWGRDMYEILLRSKIVINRHGEVAQGFANNMRCYEATGCGALLLTDNETDLFTENEIVRYSSPVDCVMKIEYYLKHEDERAAIAARGQKRTLRDHTYASRMLTVSNVLKEMLVTA